MTQVQSIASAGPLQTDRPNTARTRLGPLWALVLLSLAVAASSFRIVIAPGFEMYLGPLFYLLAFRHGGIRIGLPVAIAVMAPTWFWWGHGYSVALACVHILYLWRLRDRRWSFSLRTLVFYLTAGAIANAVIMMMHYHATVDITALSWVRKLLNDLTIAAVVDLACALIRIDLRGGRLGLRTSVRLSQLIEASTLLIVALSALAMFVADVRGFPRAFATFEQDIRQRVDLSILQQLHTHQTSGGIERLATNGITSLDVALAASRTALTGADIKRRLACQRIDDGGPVVGPNDRNTFAYWITACQLKQTRVGGRPIFYLYSTRPIAEAAYHAVLVDMIGPAVILVLAILIQGFIASVMRRSIQAWDEVVAGLGLPVIAPPSGLIFSEFRSPIASFVAANNHRVSLVQERRRLVDAVGELKRGIDLRLVSDVWFDTEGGALRFTEISIDCAPEATSLKVHPNDWLALANARNEREAFIEFRLGSSDHDDWYLLLARDPSSEGRWQSGCILRLRQAQIAQDRLLQKARLIELGGMASAISHEIKQPLFTIALAAENGIFLLDSGDVTPLQAQARVKFDRIIEQVDRARSIIARISHYARIDSGDGEPFDLAEGVRTATTFMRPLLVQEDVRIDVIVDTATSSIVRLPRVGLEQIIVNTIQNAVDSIVTRRAQERDGLAGMIEIRIGSNGDGLSIRLTDNGAGLSVAEADTAFEAFMTTKAVDKGTGLGLYISRQIMMEVGGTITLKSRPLPEQGAVVTLELPASATVSTVDPAGRA